MEPGVKKSLVQRQVASTRHRVGPAHLSRKDTPVKGSCWLPPAGSFLVFDPKRHSWCFCHSPGAAQDGDALGTQCVSANQSQDPVVAKVLDPSFQTQGLDKWSRTFSLSAGDHGFCILLPSPEGKVQPRRQEFYFGAPKQRISLQTSATSFCLNETRYACPLLQSWFLDTSSKS